MEILGTPQIPFNFIEREPIKAHAAKKISKLLRVRRDALVKRERRRKVKLRGESEELG